MTATTNHRPDCRWDQDNGPVSAPDPTCSPASAASTVDFALHAWVDESIHTPAPDSVGMYVLACVVADPSGCEQPRQALRDLVPKGRARLHWRDEGEPLRRKITAAIVACDFASVVVVGVELDPGNQERPRRKCMKRLLFELDQMGVSQVWLESRTQTLNRQDMFLVERLRGERAIGKGLRVDIGLPSFEPMLWVPDAIAGAVAAARKGGETEHRATLGTMVQEIEIPL